MRIQYLSDLHLEFPENKDYLREHPIVPVGEVLVMAGDVLPFVVMDKYSEFLNYLSAQFEQVYWLPGNHEYYHYDIGRRSGAFCEAIRKNVFLINNQSVEIDNNLLVFSTMWSKLDFQNWWQIRENMNDFRIIKCGDNLFGFDDYNRLHGDGLDFIENELKRDGYTQKAVITHHVPTYLQYPPKYKGSLLSEAFAVELYPLIEECQPDYWVYGHHHFNTGEFSIGKTRLLTNQLGYVRYKEHRLFRPDSYFDF